MARINVLRQYSAGSHNAPIQYLASQGGHEVRTHEYDLSSNISNIGGNLHFLATSLRQTRDERIVLGAEPFDPLVPLFCRLADRHHVVLHTSWPRWEPGGDVPQPARFDWQHQRWESFLGKVQAVGVTSAATVSVAEAGASGAAHIPHSVDTDTYHPGATADLDVESADPVVLYVGRLERRKGVAQLVDLITDWDGPDVEFWFVGKGPLLNDISELADESNQVRYFGYVSDEQSLAAIYASADIFTLPSYRVDGWEELFGIVLIEALSSGLPVVTTDCVGPSEIIEHGRTGYVIPQHNSEVLLNRIAHLVSSPSRREKMGRQARQEAEERYDSKIVAEDWQHILNI